MHHRTLRRVCLAALIALVGWTGLPATPAGAGSPRPVLIVNGFNGTDSTIAGLKSYLQGQPATTSSSSGG